MLNVEWSQALASLCFLEAYRARMKDEVAMKNEKLKQQDEPKRPAPAPAPPRPSWPAHRRFWHRRVTPAPPPQAPPTKPAPPAAKV